MIDATGAIYVIGGYNGLFGAYSIIFKDVWASTDGGARAGIGSGEYWLGKYTGGYYRGTQGF